MDRYRNASPGATMIGEHYEPFEKILPCLTSMLGGRNEIVRRRRRALLEFFHYCVIFSETGHRDPLAAIVHAAGYAELCADALDRLAGSPSDELSQRVYEDVDATWRVLDAALRHGERAFSRGDVDAAGRECDGALGRIYQWTDGLGTLRAHLFVRTEEMVNDELLGKERSQFLAAARDCLKEAIE